MDDEWQVEKGTGWVSIPGFGRINPRRDNVAGGRQYFTAKTDNDEFAKVTGDSITGGPETWYYEPDQPFLLADRTGRCVEVEISILPDGRYAVKSRPGDWPSGVTGHHDPTEIPVLRIVWMAENGVNEQPLNALLGSLAGLGTAGQSSWFNPTTRSKEEHRLLYAALEELRVSTNELTRLLAEVIKVENRQHNESFNFRFGQCIAEVLLRKLNRHLTATIDVLETAPPADHWDLLRQAKKWISDWYDEAVPPAYRDLRDRVLDNADVYSVELSDFLREQIATERLASISRLERSARSKLQHINNASGEIGAKSLAQGFSNQTDKEALRAGWWTFAVVLSVILGIVLPALALTTEKVIFSSTVNEATGTIIKALTGLPLFALAAYFGRISSQHRETERYLRILTTQINTVQAYADVLPQPERGQLVSSLGIRAFGDPGFTVAESGKVTVIPSEIVELLKKAMDAARSGK